MLKKVCAITVCVTCTLLTVTLFLSFATYTDDPTEYRVGDTFFTSMEPIASKESIARWPYYRYPFPKAPGYSTPKEAFFYAFSSLYRNIPSGYMHLMWEDTDTPTCFTQSAIKNETNFFFSQTALDNFYSAIHDGERIQLEVDGVPVISRHKTGWWWGFDIGYTVGKYVLLYNHVDFNIDVDNAGRVIKVVAVPRHTNSIDRCGRASDVPNHPVDRVKWTYRTWVRRTNLKRKDMINIYDELMNPGQRKIKYSMFIITAVIASCVMVIFGYFLYRICVNNRLDIDDIDSLLPARRDSVRVVEPNVEEVVDVEMDLLRRRESSSSEIEIDLSFSSRPSTKHFLIKEQHAIMGPPAFPRILAVIVGSSVQLCFIVFLALLISLAYQHSWNNAYQVITIILLATTGGIPGFITTRILLQWNVKVGPCNLFGCILAVSAPIHILFFIVTQMKMLHRDWNTTVGFIFISLSLFVINVVTYLAGMFLSTAYPPAERRRTGSQMPYRFSSCMARISANVIACTVVACLQGFGAIGLAYQFVTTPWETRVKQKIGFTLAFSATWLFCGAMLAILASYFIVAKVRNPSWHWSTFFMGALSGVVVFLFSIVYVYDSTTYNDQSNTFITLVYLIVCSVMIGLISGSVGWLSMFIFLSNGIYGRLVIKD